ncbi:helix-turn-helix domain-containing protein [Velocimicrobium porci]|uniref:Helix-turn-helix transcriptional regulator n=1 Tax=Velocimicrobium porci TaxID=2606634 RepID=A0A6L5XZR0_9FIRM|nr:helix-turn-helix transcriptional regulator [Velocimicrobium porci]MSS64067.1 helix-turn-helix transcriptional regulator [Velocimicrobium porci]
MAIDYHIIGQRIKEKRHGLKKTQEDLAEFLSVSVGYVSQIERGITKVNLDTLSKISIFLECDIADLLHSTSYQSNDYLNQEFSELILKLNDSNRKLAYEILYILLKSQ